jgi:hypothetical protein
MERIKVTVVCDRCGEDTDLAAGSGTELRFGGLVAEVDLCEVCHKELLAQLEGVLDNGRAPGSATGARRERKQQMRVLCSECGKYFKEGAGMTLHQVRIHGGGGGNGNAKSAG